MKTVLASKTAKFYLEYCWSTKNHLLDQVKSVKSVDHQVFHPFNHDHRGEEPGAQEKWMKATCTEAVYLSLGEAAQKPRGRGFLGDEK